MKRNIGKFDKIVERCVLMTAGIQIRRRKIEEKKESDDFVELLDKIGSL